MDEARPLAVVTGASSGIGRELAEQFATNGFDVLIAAVARDGSEGLMSRKERVVSHSRSKKLQERASRVLPDRAKAAMHRRMADPQDD